MEYERSHTFWEAQHRLAPICLWNTCRIIEVNLDTEIYSLHTKIIHTQLWLVSVNLTSAVRGLHADTLNVVSVQKWLAELSMHWQQAVIWQYCEWQSTWIEQNTIGHSHTAFVLHISEIGEKWPVSIMTKTVAQNPRSKRLETFISASLRIYLGCEVANRIRSMPGTSWMWCRRSVNVHARRPDPSLAIPGKSRPYASTFWPSNVTSL